MKRFLFLTLLLTAGSVEAQSPQDLFQQALRLERSQGDLEGAISLYRQIAESADGERGTKATALFNLGRAYEALGRDEATTAYRRLVADYTEYGDLVAQAQSRLRILVPRALETIPSRPTHPGVREIELPQDVLERGFWGASLTPDGQHVLNISWAEAPKLDLTLTDLDTGAVEYLGIAENGLESYPAFPRMALDGRHVAYLVGGMDGPSVDLRVLDRETGAVRTVIENTPFMELIGWTDDLSQIIAHAAADDANDRQWKPGSLIAIDASSGDVSVILEGEQAISPLCFPAGSDHMLGSRYPADWNGSATLALVSIEVSSGDVSDVEPPPFDVNWLSCTEKYVYGSSDVYGTSGVVRWTLQDGASLVDQKFVAPASNLRYALGSAADGRILVEGSSPSLLYLAPVDANAGTIEGPVETHGSLYTLGLYGWSPDGRVLTTGSGVGAVKRFIDFGAEPAHPQRKVELEFGLLTSGLRLIWMSDGRHMVAVRDFFLDESPKKRAVLVDATTGRTVRELGEHILLDVIEGSRLLVETRPSGDESCLAVFDYEEGQTEVIHCGPYFQFEHRPAFNFADVSLDGSRAAIIVEERQGDDRFRKLFTVDLATGKADLKMEMARTEKSISTPVWLPDGSGVIYTEWDVQAEEAKYRVLDFASGESRPWLDILGSYERLSGLAIHPNGKQVAFTAWPPGKNDRLLVIEGLQR
jgi:hypothetical protein